MNKHAQFGVCPLTILKASPLNAELEFVQHTRRTENKPEWLYQPRLNPRDLKGVSIDRNVPEAVRKHATKFVKTVQK